MKDEESPKRPTINSEDLLEDPRKDTAGKILRRLESHTTWTHQKKAVLGELLAELRKGRRLEFVSDYSKYPLARVGQSALYKVPQDKRGHLARFRGRMVRLVCVGSGSHFVRKYIARPYDET